MPSRNGVAGPEVRTELVSRVEPSEGSSSLEVRRADPEGLVRVAGHEVVLELCDLGRGSQLSKVAFKEFYMLLASTRIFVIVMLQHEEHNVPKSKCVSPAAGSFL